MNSQFLFLTSLLSLTSSERTREEREATARPTMGGQGQPSHATASAGGGVQATGGRAQSRGEIKEEKGKFS